MKNIILLIILLSSAVKLTAQFDGARTYWAMPKNTNIVGFSYIKGKVNASINNLTFIQPDIHLDNNLYMLTYTRSQPLFGRTFYSTLLIPAGDITATTNIETPLPGSSSVLNFKHGLGDIIWMNTINIIGAKGLMIKDFVRHENPTLVYLHAALTFPTGQYDAESDINIGSNQTKFKLGLPMIQRIGAPVDGKRMALEIFPSYTFISNNKDHKGLELQQDGAFILETHLTRDLTKNIFLGVDYSYINGGSTEFMSGETGQIVRTQEGQKAHLVGGTMGYSISDQIKLFLTHQQSFSSGNTNTSLEGTATKLTLSIGFHDFQEKFNNYIND